MLSEIVNTRSRTCLAFLPDGTPPARLKTVDYEEFPEVTELRSCGAGATEHDPEEDKGQDEHMVADVTASLPDPDAKASQEDSGNGSIINEDPGLWLSSYRLDLLPDTEIIEEAGEADAW